MTDDQPTGPDLDAWGFVDLALQRLDERLGLAQPRATELLLSLNRASGIVIYDLESAVHRPRARSWATFRLLFVLWVTGPITSSRTAELTGMSRAGVSNLTPPLVRAGLLRREPHGTDRRAVLLSLTERGRAEIEENFAAQHARERHWADRLTPDEQQTLIQLLDKLVGRHDDST